MSSQLADYSEWPQATQVFKLESQRTDALGRTQQEVRYGITSLPAELADPHAAAQLHLQVLDTQVVSMLNPRASG